MRKVKCPRSDSGSTVTSCWPKRSRKKCPELLPWAPVSFWLLVVETKDMPWGDRWGACLSTGFQWPKCWDCRPLWACASGLLNQPPALCTICCERLELWGGLKQKKTSKILDSRPIEQFIMIHHKIIWHVCDGFVNLYVHHWVRALSTRKLLPCPKQSAQSLVRRSNNFASIMRGHARTRSCSSILFSWEHLAASSGNSPSTGLPT